MADSRRPYVPEDPAEPVPYFTITTLINYHYAKKQGADFSFVVFEGGPDGVPRTANDPICEHPRWGWRAASWCKIPAVWHTMRTHRKAMEFIFIDTDAVFRSTAIPPSRHLNHLTPFRPIGFLSNAPWKEPICAGYFFLRREAESFLKAWWDVNIPHQHLNRLWEQGGLAALLNNGVAAQDLSLSNPPYSERIVQLESEWQFEERDQLQLIHHMTSQERGDNYARIQSHWNNEMIPLDDRIALGGLLEEVQIVRLNASQVALDMDDSL